MSKKQKHTTSTKEIKEKQGFSSSKKLKLIKEKTPSVAVFVDKIRQGDIAHLSRAITLVESANAKHQKKAAQILQACLPFANKSIRVGVTGVPGVGKSTFIEVLGTYITQLNKKVAVLAIDPTSTINKGSILGDKTRMSTLVMNTNAYIRPSPSGNTLGGVAKKTREAIILCEAAGFDTIIIETVGVGQSETVVHSMVDFFLLLKLAGAGDELQGIKRGIIEMADAIVINKADGDTINAANKAKTAFTRALHLYPLKQANWQPKVTTCSALHNEGIDTVWNIISDYIQLTKESEYFDLKRKEQNKYWLIETINEQLKEQFYTQKEIVKSLNKMQIKVENQEISPFKAAQKILKTYYKKSGR